MWQQIRGWVSRHRGAMVTATVLLILSFVAIFYIFAWGHPFKPFKEEYVVDNELWGNFGDLIGGVGSAFFALVALALTIITLWLQHSLTQQSNALQQRLTAESNALQERLTAESNSQQERLTRDAQAHELLLNQTTIAEAELQRFNDLYDHLIHLYYRQREILQNAMPNLANSAQQNIDFMLPEGSFTINYDELSRQFPKSFFDYYIAVLQGQINPQSRYGDAVNQVVNRYMNFYLSHANLLAPYFRTIYRIFDLIEEFPIEEEEKKRYAKITRALFSEAELLFMRYNAFTPYGDNMVKYVNKYRLLKHLPITSLLEFRASMTPMLAVMPIEEVLRLNVLFYDLKRQIFGITVGHEERPTAAFVYNKDNKFQINLDLSDENLTQLDIYVQNQAQNYNPIHYNPYLRPLRSVPTEQIGELFKVFLRDLYVYDNFDRYQSRNEFKVDAVKDTNNPSETHFTITAQFSMRAQQRPLRLRDACWDE